MLTWLTGSTVSGWNNSGPKQAAKFSDLLDCSSDQEGGDRRSSSSSLRYFELKTKCEFFCFVKQTHFDQVLVRFSDPITADYSGFAFLVLCWAFGHTHRASKVRDLSCLLYAEAHKNYRIFWSGVTRCIVWAYIFCIEKVWNVWAPAPGNVLPLGSPKFGEGPTSHWWKAKCRLFLCLSLASLNLAHNNILEN